MGLGSVIMVAIARLYGGSVSPENRIDGGKAVGGRVLIKLNIGAHEHSQPARAS